MLVQFLLDGCLALYLSTVIYFSTGTLDFTALQELTSKFSLCAAASHLVNCVAEM